MAGEGLSPHGQEIIRKGRKLFTHSVIDGKLRFWNPRTSKLAALLLKKSDFQLPAMDSILYLGGGHGTTVSHLSDLMNDGRIFVIEFGITMDDILRHTKDRSNILPIMENASNPATYCLIIPPESVDLMYQDIAQRDQPGILISNLRFLKPGGWFIFMVKLKSIAQNQNAEGLKDSIILGLNKTQQVTIDGTYDLEPYQKDHIVIFGKKAI